MEEKWSEHRSKSRWNVEVRRIYIVVLHMATSLLDILVDELGLKENKSHLYAVCI